MTAVEAQTIVTERGRLEFARVGSGPPVLLVHGTPGSWRQLVPLAHDLADRHTVLLPSRPGYGRTPIASGRTPSQQAALYIALLDALELSGRVGVVGVSGGGPSTLAFAHDHPERTSALALVCALAAHLMPIPAPMRLVAALPVIARPFSVVSRRRQRSLLADDSQVDARITRDLTADERQRLAGAPAIRDDLVEFLHSHAYAPSGLYGLANDVRQMHGARALAHPADAVTAPTLVLHGAADTVVPIAHAHHHAAVIPHAEVEVFSDAGHVFLLTRRTETAAALRAHLLRNQ